MVLENAATNNNKWRSVCTPSCLDAALGYLSETACVPDYVYREAHDNKGLVLESTVLRLGGKWLGRGDMGIWATAAKTLAVCDCADEFRNKLELWERYLTREDVAWIRDKLASVDEYSWKMDLMWWTTLQMAARVARNLHSFSALVWETDGWSHVLLFVLGHPGESRSNDLLIWDRGAALTNAGFGWEKIMTPYGRLKSGCRELSGLFWILFGDCNIRRAWFEFFQLDACSGALAQKDWWDQFAPGWAPESRL